MMLAVDGRFRLLTAGAGASEGCRGRLRDVLEPLKEDRKLLRLNSLRTPEGRRCGCSGEDVVLVGTAEAGEYGVRKLSAFSTLPLNIDVFILARSSKSRVTLGVIG